MKRGHFDMHVGLEAGGLDIEYSGPLSDERHSFAVTRKDGAPMGDTKFFIRGTCHDIEQFAARLLLAAGEHDNAVKLRTILGADVA